MPYGKSHHLCLKQLVCWLSKYIYIYIYIVRERVVYSRIVLMFFELSNALTIVKHTVQYQYQLFFLLFFVCLNNMWKQHKATFVFAEPSQLKLSAQPLVSTCFRLVLLPVCTYVWCCWWFSVWWGEKSTNTSCMHGLCSASRAPVRALSQGAVLFEGLLQAALAWAQTTLHHQVRERS